MNLVLVGFMASGKTAVGRRIARRLGYGFLDMDQHIEREVGCSISQLFEIEGEAYFRTLETRLLSHLHKLDNYVVSTGGGVLTTEGNLEILRKVGVTAFLNADREEILKRLERDTRRPKLQEGGLEETVARLLDERMPLYTQCDITIDTKGKTANRVAGEIIRGLSRAASEKGTRQPGEPPARDAATGARDGARPEAAPEAAGGAPEAAHPPAPPQPPAEPSEEPSAESSEEGRES